MGEAAEAHRFWPEGASGHPGTGVESGQASHLLPGGGGFLPPMLPFWACPHSPSCTVPITGVQTLDPIQRSKIALNVNQGVGWSRGTSVSYPPQEQGAGKTTPNRKSLQKAYCLLVLWLPTLLASFFFHRANWGFKRFFCYLPQITQKENKTRFSPGPSNLHIPLSSHYWALSRCQASQVAQW